MKRIVLVLLVLSSFNSFGQLEQDMPQPAYKTKQLRVIDKLQPPVDTSAFKIGIARIGTTLYAGNGSYWTAASGGGGGTSLTGLDTLPYPARMVVQDSSGTTPYFSHATRVFNVKDFGATGDGVTSDVAAIQRTIDYAFARGGGKVYFPNGVYIIDNDPVHTPDSIPLTCQVCIPFSRWDSESSEFRTIELVGESISSPEQQALATFETPLNGAVLKSTWITTTGGPFGNPISVIGYVGTYETGLFQQLNYTQLIVRDLSVLVSTKNPSGTEVQNIMSGINMSYFATGSLKGDVRIRSTSAPLAQITPYTGSYGFISPTVSNHAHMNNDNLTVSGFHTGAKLSEHASFQTFIVGSTLYGLDIEPYYTIQISHFIEENNAYAIRVRNSASLVIGAYESESYTSSVTYFNKVADFTEYSANASGLISIQAGVWNASGGARNPTIIGDSLKIRLHSDRYGNSYIPLTTNTTVRGLSYNQPRYDTTNKRLQRWTGSAWENIGTADASTTQLNYLSSATGTTGTASTNLVFSTSPLFTTPRLASTSTTGYVWTATDASGNGSFQAASGGGISGLTTNELVYGNSATTIASLPVATYPSLTELSYVKGLTSAAQTQLNTKVGALAAIGSTANANGASISGSTLTLQPASASFGGVVTTGTQTFAGAKTFTGTLAGVASTWSGRITSSLNGAVSAPPLTMTGTWYAAGTATTTKPHLLIEPTGATSTGWNTAGTGLGLNAATGYVGNLIDAQLNGVSKFKVDYAGTATLTGGVTATRFSFTSTNGVWATASGSSRIDYIGQGVTTGYLIDALGAYNTANTTRNAVSIFDATSAQLTWSSGTNTFNSLQIAPRINITGGTTTVRGIYYNPTLTSVTGVTNVAFEATSGSVIAPKFQVSTSVFWSSGTGSPEGVLTANIGSLYSRTDGGAGTSLYVKESGTGNTGWVAK